MKGPIVLLAIVFTLSGCTFPSNHLFTGMNYREKPLITLIEYDAFLKLQKDCGKQHGIPFPLVFYSGCALVPYNESKSCVIRVMTGDSATFAHEYRHCQGFKDTFIPGF